MCIRDRYRNDTLEALYFEVGRLFFEENVVHYEYSLKDHLGNQRVLFSDRDNNGSIEDNEVSEISSFYPFGMRHEGSNVRVNETCDYLYNNQELNTDFGLNWYDYGNRSLDPTTGQFTSIDRFAGKYASMTPYQYGANNPIKFIDVNGDSLRVNFSGQDAKNAFIRIMNNGLEGQFNVNISKNGTVTFQATEGAVSYTHLTLPTILLV